MNDKIKSQTKQKFNGICHHSFIRHSPEQYWLFSGRSSNTEKEEAQFNALKTFTNLTFNHHSENVVFNLIICLQAKQALTEGENHIMKMIWLYQPIKATLFNSLIPFEWIEKHATCCQVPV